MFGDGVKTGRHSEHRFWDESDYHEILTVHEARQRRFRTCTAKADNEQVLAGIIHCARCGKRLYNSCTNASTKAYRAYHCQNGYQQGQPSCPGMTVRAQWVEDEVVKELERFAALPEMRALILEEATRLADVGQATMLKERQRLTQTVHKTTQKFDSAFELYSEGTLPKADFERLNQKHQQERSQAQARLCEIEGVLNAKEVRESSAQRIHETLSQFPLIWEHLDLSERREVLCLLLEKLSADREDRLIHLTIKVHMLPERKVVIPYRSNRGKNRSNLDPVAQLTQRELSVLYYVQQGLGQAEIATRIGVEKYSVKKYMEKMRRNFGHQSIEDIVKAAAARIEAVTAYLPLGDGAAARRRGFGLALMWEARTACPMCQAY